MQLIEISSAASAQDFLLVNVEVNKGNPNYTRPLDKDINDVFDPNKNKAFRHGKCQRWVLKSDDGRLIGRVAAFTNKKYKNKGDDLPVGGMGFFDCINDQAAANMLFDAARDWLAKEGMEAMDGPINFGERDRWWGLVTEGFQPPLYCMNYNYPYYQQLFENYGFRLFFNQLCFGMKVRHPLNAKLFERHARLSADPAYRACHIRKNELEKFAGDFTVVYNKAWAGHGGLKELKKEQVLTMFKTMKPVLDERVAWFAYHNDQPIAIFINLPDVNQYFKRMNGRFGLLQKLYFLWLLKTLKVTRLTGLVFGVVPEFQGLGADAFIVVESAKIIQPHTPYLDYEMQWIGDFNPKMVNVAQTLSDTFKSRQLTTYRYLFDRARPFQRHPILL